MKKRILNENEIIEIVNLFSKGVQVSNIYKILSISPKLVKKVLLERGMKVRAKRTYNINEESFKDINTEEKAYWLGFLYADGRVRSFNGTYGLDLWLSIKDENHIFKFKTFLQSDHPIVYRTNKIKYKSSISISYGVGINVCSKKIIEDLFRLGCVQNKTYRIDSPNIKEELYRHFIRGYFDGDGCISIKKNYSGKIFKFSSSSIKILEWISDVFKKQDIFFSDLRKIKNYYELYTSKKENIYKIYDFFYTNSTIYLNRKKEKFEETIRFCKPQRVVQIDIDGTIKKKWDDVVTASRDSKIRKDLILRCCEKKLNSAGGYKWEFYK